MFRDKKERATGGCPKRKERTLRAIVEIRAAELLIYSVADSDVEERTILEALCFVFEQGGAR
jgi:hypothetical protein